MVSFLGIWTTWESQTRHIRERSWPVSKIYCLDCIKCKIRRLLCDPRRGVKQTSCLVNMNYKREGIFHFCTLSEYKDQNALFLNLCVFMRTRLYFSLLVFLMTFEDFWTSVLQTIQMTWHVWRRFWSCCSSTEEVKVCVWQDSGIMRVWSARPQWKGNDPVNIIFQRIVCFGRFSAFSTETNRRFGPCVFVLWRPDGEAFRCYCRMENCFALFVTKNNAV